MSRYTDLLVDLLLVRRLASYHVHVGKRLVKSPKVYLRDSGLVHTLVGIGDRDAQGTGNWKLGTLCPAS